MVLTLWRFVVLWSLLFWQGGFLFYAAVVVPTAQQVIGHQQQGFITRHVSVWLNVAGIVALVVLAVDFFVDWDRRPARRWLLVLCWLGMTGTLVALLLLHPHMDALMDAESYVIDRRSHFRYLHRIYLWTITGQWACAVAHTLLLMSAWRCHESASESSGARARRQPAGK